MTRQKWTPPTAAEVEARRRERTRWDREHREAATPKPSAPDPGLPSTEADFWKWLAGDGDAPDAETLLDWLGEGDVPSPDATETDPAEWTDEQKLQWLRAAVKAWQNRPPLVEAESRSDPILPVVQSVTESPEREAGRVAYGGIAEGRKLPDGQLPMFAAPRGPRVPLLELADFSGRPILARGRGAPLDLRLFVGACIMTPHSVRAGRGRLKVRVRELRDFCYPNGWERRRHWPAIRRALWKARDYVIPGPFEWEGSPVHDWLPFQLVGGASEDAGLDDTVLIDVELPPGSAHGSPIDRRTLALLGVESAPRFRAFVAAHSVQWLPGKTRVPHPRNRRFRMWVSNPDAYAVLTTEDRRRLAFGEADSRNRTRAEQDAPWESLPGVDILDRRATLPDGRQGWLIAPAEAAAVIRSEGRQPENGRATT